MASESEDRARVVAIAKTWIGTPFHDNAMVKGAGVDCAMLIKGVWLEAGLIPAHETPHYSRDHYLNSPEERFRGQILRFAHEIAEDQVKPGDVALYRVGLALGHGAIVIDPCWPNIIHAHYAARRVVRGNGLQPHLGKPVKEIRFFSRW